MRCDILRQVAVSRVREIVAEVPLDGHIASFIRENRERCTVVTGNLDIWVGDLIERLGCASSTSIGVAKDDRLESVTRVLRKDEAVRALRDRGFDRVVAIGESFNDIPMFEAADAGVAFGGVHPPIPQIVALADHVVDGGESLCELLESM